MNRLGSETSPYLLQHADNPVDWYPWSPEAFATARAEDRPVFLSIGYSSCHWCHVMAEESFSDPEVAALMNETFVSIKVDREERPDIDASYMAMAQVMIGQAGWPLNVLMAPDGRPFYIGTYIPRESVPGHIGMLELIPRVGDVWRTRRDELLQSADGVVNVTRSYLSPSSGQPMSEEVVALAARQISEQFDPVSGGFGNAPKFPMAPRLAFLLHHWRATGDVRSLSIVRATLEAMRLGGVYDQVGGGFHRYSVDRGWNVPHFEKMLYDQALLAVVYVDAWRATGDEWFGGVAREVLDYMLERLQSPDGGFYSAEDADSEGIEGRYYLWTVAEMRALLTADELDVLLRTAGIEDEGAAGTDGAAYVLRLASRPDAAEWTVLRSAFAKLRVAREERVRPGMDDKVTADWNGLAIAALALGGRALGEERFTTAAARCAAFVLERMRDSGRLMHSWRAGRASVPGFLEDYAFMAHGLLELYQATQEEEHLREAVDLTRQMVSLFRDDEGGGFFQAARDAERTVLPMKPVHDGAIPSGGSVAALVLVRIGRLTDDRDLEQRADEVFASCARLVEAAPGEFPAMLSAYRLHLDGVSLCLLAGEGDEMKKMARQVGITYMPGSVLVVVPEGEVSPGLEALVPSVAEAESAGEPPVALLCSGSACSSPAHTVEQLKALLQGGTPGGLAV